MLWINEETPPAVTLLPDRSLRSLNCKAFLNFDFFGFAEFCTKNQSLTGETNSDLTVTQTSSLLHPNAHYVRTSLNRSR
jgi:hypothetical protein